MRKLTGNRDVFHRWVNRVLITVNGVLYGLFILFVLLFNFLVTVPTAQCGGRLIGSLQQANDIGRVRQSRLS